MFSGLPDITKGGFIAVLDEAIRKSVQGPPWLGCSIPCAVQPGEVGAFHTAPSVRIGVQLEGLQQGVLSVLGTRVDVELTPGQGIYLPPHGWYVEFPHTIGLALGVALHPDYVRLLQVMYTGRRITESTPWFYHTAGPLGGAGMGICQALNALAEEGKRFDWTCELFIALLHAVRQHLLEDDPSRGVHGRAQHTWRAVRAFLYEHFTPRTNRQSVAQAMGLHANYLSALARQMTGQPFRAALDEVRMDRARRLLRHTQMKITAIAAECGYANHGNFIKAFRRATGITPGRFRRPGGGQRSEVGDQRSEI